MEILLLIALIVINGLFAMSEIALVTARRARLARLAEDGDGSAAVAIKLHDEPTRFLSTIQIGITSIGILNGKDKCTNASERDVRECLAVNRYGILSLPGSIKPCQMLGL